MRKRQRPARRFQPALCSCATAGAYLEQRTGCAMPSHSGAKASARVHRRSGAPQIVLSRLRESDVGGRRVRQGACLAVSKLLCDDFCRFACFIGGRTYAYSKFISEGWVRYKSWIQKITLFLLGSKTFHKASGEATAAATDHSCTPQRCPLAERPTLAAPADYWRQPCI
eukprot:scaffold576_cov260-Pinguiococcus_pyrenoidosus.AAC.4